jgi:ubiquinone/menaquinone biosynthesis C-methylase UbiE
MDTATNLLDQCRNPKGWLGRFLLWTMNVRHSKVADWGLQHVSVGKRDTILDVGCGGGNAIRKLAAMATEGRVYGIDHSEGCVVVARKHNKREVATGRVDIRQASVSHLPFPDNMFDLCTAVETHFFWPDLCADMREVLRILKPGGKLLVVAEVYKGGKHDKRIPFLEQQAHMTVLSIDEHRELFEKAGFSDVHIESVQDKGWICGIGTRPT